MLKCYWIDIARRYQSTAYGDCQVVDIFGDGSLIAASFDGDGDYLELGQGYNVSDSFTLNVVLCCLDPYRQYSSFFAKYDTSGEGPYAYSINSGHVNCWFSTPEGSASVESGAKITLGTWHLITIRYDAGQINLFIDGVLDSALELSAGTVQNQDMVTIGRQALLYDPIQDLQFNGFIRSVELHKEALTDEQIQYYCENLDLGQLPSLVAQQVIAEDVPLWGLLDDGTYEILSYVPEGAVVVFLDDAADQYIRVSYHGMQGNMDCNYLTDLN